MSLWDVHYPYPDPASSLFYTQLIAFDEGNDPARFEDMFNEFVVTGMLHDVPSPGSTTTDPISGEAYSNAGAYILQESTTITYNLGNGTYWTLATGDDELVAAGWTRQVGTHFMFKLDGAEPAIPHDSVLLMKVTVAGGVITTVEDYRKLYPIEDQFRTLFFIMLEDPDVIQYLTDLIIDIILTDPEVLEFLTNLILSIIASLDFVEGANVGTGQGEVFRDSSGSLPETLNFKTLKQGSGITITNNANDITIAGTVTDTTYTASNVGGGDAEVFAELDGTDFEFRTISGLGGIDVSENGDVIEIDGTGLFGSFESTYGDVVASDALAGYELMYEHSWGAGDLEAGHHLVATYWGSATEGASNTTRHIRVDWGGGTTTLDLPVFIDTAVSPYMWKIQVDILITSTTGQFIGAELQSVNADTPGTSGADHPGRGYVMHDTSNIDVSAVSPTLRLYGETAGASLTITTHMATVHQYVTTLGAP